MPPIRPRRFQRFQNHRYFVTGNKDLLHRNSQKRQRLVIPLRRTCPWDPRSHSRPSFGLPPFQPDEHSPLRVNDDALHDQLDGFLGLAAADHTILFQDSADSHLDLEQGEALPDTNAGSQAERQVRAGVVRLCSVPSVSSLVETFRPEHERVWPDSRVVM